MPSFSARGTDIRVARVLHEDDAAVTLEVIKNENRPMEVRDGDKFWTVIFVHQKAGGVHPWLPWEAASED